VTTLGLLALLLAGCGALAPPYERPGAHRWLAQFPLGQAGPADQLPASDIAWQQFFQDARLRS
jgi:outer membrane protein TolC